MRDDRFARILATLPPDDAAWLLDRLAPRWMQRAQRLDARDEALRELAGAHYGHLASGRAQAEAVAVALLRYRESGWRVEETTGPIGGDPARALLHRALTLNGGRPLTPAQVRRILAGLRSCK